MGYGHRLYGSQRILCYLADGQRLPPDHIHSLFQYEKRNSGTISGSHTSVMLRRIGMGVILTLLCGVFSEELISCVIDSEGIREYGTPLVRTLLLSGPVMGILFIYINTLQAIGAEAAQPVADILSLLLAVWLFWRTEKRMGKGHFCREFAVKTNKIMDLNTVKTVVVKIGTSTLTYENGKMNLRRIDKLCRTLCDLQNGGRRIVLVTSGAICLKLLMTFTKRYWSKVSFTAIPKFPVSLGDPPFIEDIFSVASNIFLASSRTFSPSLVSLICLPTFSKRIKFSSS